MRASLINKIVGVLFLIASFFGLVCFVCGFVALWEIGALTWLVRSHAGWMLLAIQIGFGLGTLFMVSAARASYRGWWREAFIYFTIGIVLVGVLFYYLGEITRVARNSRTSAPPTRVAL